MYLKKVQTKSLQQMQQKIRKQLHFSGTMTFNGKFLSGK